MVFGFDTMLICSDTVKKMYMQSIVNDCIDLAFLLLFFYIYINSQVALPCLTYQCKLILYDVLMAKNLFKSLLESEDVSVRVLKHLLVFCLCCTVSPDAKTKVLTHA